MAKKKATKKITRKARKQTRTPRIAGAVHAEVVAERDALRAELAERKAEAGKSRNPQMIERLKTAMQAVENGQAVFLAIERQGANPVDASEIHLAGASASPEFMAKTAFQILDDSAIVTTLFKRLALLELMGE